MISHKEGRDLLSKLCVELGFCLPRNDQVRMEENPPSDVVAFTDAVFLAEALDPATADRHVYRQVREMVAAAFRDAEYDGV